MLTYYIQWLRYTEYLAAAFQAFHSKILLHLRWLKWLLVPLAALGLLVLFLSWYIPNKFEKQLANIAVTYINKFVVTPITASSVELKVLSTFPMASLEFNTILCKEAIPDSSNADTLFYFNRLGLQFNILDLYNGNYNLQKIVADGGNVYLKDFKGGGDNYHIVRELPKDSTDTTTFQFQLQDVDVTDVRFKYQNNYKKDLIDVSLKKLELSGDFSATNFDLDARLDGLVNSYLSNDVNYITNRDCELEGALTIDAEKQVYTTKKLYCKFSRDLDFIVNGVLEEHFVNCEIAGDNISVEKLRALIPNEYTKSFSDFDASGKIDFLATVKGGITKKQSPQVELSFSTENATVKNNKTDIELKNIILKGTYNSTDATTKREKLVFEQFDATLGNSDFALKGSLIDFNHPQIDLKANGTFILKEVKEFLNADTLEVLEGNAKVNVAFKGLINNPSKITARDFLQSRTEGTIDIANGSLKLQNDPYLYSNLNGLFTFSNSDLKVNDFKGNIGQNDFVIDGIFRNALPYIFVENERVTLAARFRSKRFNLNELFANSSQTNKNDSLLFQFPERLQFNLNAFIDELEFGRFKAENIKGNILLLNNRLAIKPMLFNSASGAISGELFLDQVDANNFKISSSIFVEHANVQQLFWEFKDFGQSSLQSRHIRGEIDAHISFSTSMDKNFNINTKVLKSESAVIISNGELIGFEPMKYISDGIRDQKLVSKIINPDELQKKLEQIKFSTLENQIKIENETVFIPMMDIKSSALDIKVEGKHTFNQEIDYAIQFSLRDLIKKKPATAEELALVENIDKGGIQVYMKITGTVDNPEIDFDKKSIKKSMTQDLLNAPKISTKDILNSDINFFKKQHDAEVKEMEKKSTEELEMDFSNVFGTDPTAPVVAPADSAKVDTSKTSKGFKKILPPSKKDKKDNQKINFEDDY